MSNIISFDDGEILDLDTIDGVYEHVARFLREKGADSDIFCSLNRLKKWSDSPNKSLKPTKKTPVQIGSWSIGLK